MSNNEMTENQKRWLDKKISELDKILDLDRLPTDEELEQAVQFVADIVEQAKGKTEDKRPEVRQILLDRLEHWEKHHYGRF